MVSSSTVDAQISRKSCFLFVSWVLSRERKVAEVVYLQWNTYSIFFPEYLKVRSHDPEEAIRHDVIVSIVTAAKKDLLLVNDHLLNFVRERTLDKRVRHN